VTREEIRDAVLDAVQNPVATGRGGRPGELAEVLKLVVFLEAPVHFHVALKLSKRVVFLPYKLALRRRAGLASHWSTSHKEFYSTVRHGRFSTHHKPVVDETPLTWTPDGKALDLYVESQEPWNARAFMKKRELAEASAGGQAVSTSKKVKDNETAKSSKLDCIALVASRQLMTPAAVLDHVQTGGSDAMRAFATKHQRRLQEYIDDAAEWGRAAEVAAAERQGDWELIESLARKTCKCGNGLCQWWEAADDFFRRNAQSINRLEFAACLAKVIREGPGKTSRVPLIVGASNSAKSTVLNPIVQVFGFPNVVHRPGEKASMALTNVTKRNKRFIFWDEYRPVEYAARGTVPVGTFLSLFGGASLEIQVSQSFQFGNSELIWARGAAMTAKDEGLWDPIPPLPGLVPVCKEDIRHMQNRVFQFHAAAPLPQERLAGVPACRETFCRWLLAEAAAAAMGPVQRPVRRLAGRAPPPMPAAGAPHGQAAALVARPTPTQCPAPSRAGRAAPLTPGAGTAHGAAAAPVARATPTLRPAPSRAPPSPDPGEEERELLEDALARGESWAADPFE